MLILRTSIPVEHVSNDWCTLFLQIYNLSTAHVQCTMHEWFTWWWNILWMRINGNIGKACLHNQWRPISLWSTFRLLKTRWDTSEYLSDSPSMVMRHKHRPHRHLLQTVLYLCNMRYEYVLSHLACDQWLMLVERSHAACVLAQSLLASECHVARHQDRAGNSLADMDRNDGSRARAKPARWARMSRMTMQISFRLH